MSDKTLFILSLLLITGPIAAEGVRLRDMAGVKTDVVQLGDVADLKGSAAIALSPLVVGRFELQQRQVIIELSTVRAILDGLGVNWGKLSLGGFRQCKVSRIKAQAPAISRSQSTVISNPSEPVDTHTAVTLRQQLVDYLAGEAGCESTDLVINFRASDDKSLAQSAMGRQFEIVPKSSASLGRIPITVREWNHKQVVNEYRLTADVALRTLAVVTTGSLRRNTLIGSGDVKVCEVLVRDARGRPLTSLDQVVGQATRGVMQQGTMIYPDSLRSPLLVRRNELIKVEGIYGGLVVKAIARAKEDAEMGQIIEARRVGSRKEFSVRIVGLRRAELITADAPKSAQVFDIQTGRMALQ